MTHVFSSLAPRRAFLTWLFIGTSAAALMQFAQAQAMGTTPEGLLFAGTLQEVHPLVVEELPDTPVFDGFGHDGQIFYAVGLDLRGEWVPDTLLSAPYRYRRVLYPALASGLGTMGGSSMLWGMIVLASLPVGIAAGTVSLIGTQMRLHSWAPMAVLLNPGTWLSSRLLTADNLALAMGLLAILAFIRRRDAWAVVALAGAALAKEPMVAVALGLVGYAWFSGDRTRSLKLMLGAALPVVAWWSYIAVAVGNPLDSGGNVVIPLTGLFEAVPTWLLQSGKDWFYLTSALIGFALGIWVLVKGPRLWAWLVGPWLAVAAASSHLVWDIGNNAVRAFAPLLTLGILGLLGSSAKARWHQSSADPIPASP